MNEMSADQKLDVILDRMESRFDTLESRFDTLESRFDKLEEKVDVGFACMDENFANVSARLRKIENKQYRDDRNVQVEHQSPPIQ